MDLILLETQGLGLQCLLESDYLPINPTLVNTIALNRYLSYRHHSFLTFPHPSCFNDPKTSSATSVKLLTVLPLPLGPGSINAATLLTTFPTSKIVPPTFSSRSMHANIASATSSALTHSSIPSFNSFILSGLSVHNGVLMIPGATAVTLMPRRASRGARDRTKPLMACLEAQYIGLVRTLI